MACLSHNRVEQSETLVARTNMKMPFTSTEKRAAFSAVMIVLGVLAIGAIAKSEGAARLVQMNSVTNNDAVAHLMK